MPDLNEFVDWVKEGKGSRRIEIEIGNFGDEKHLKIWAYDYDLLAGQYVKSVAEIDLEAKKTKDEKEQYEKLKAKFEEGKVC